MALTFVHSQAPKAFFVQHTNRKCHPWEYLRVKYCCWSSTLFVVAIVQPGGKLFEHAMQVQQSTVMCLPRLFVAEFSKERDVRLLPQCSESETPTQDQIDRLKGLISRISFKSAVLVVLGCRGWG
eukprot:4610521-Amphidinium_carterae.1